MAHETVIPTEKQYLRGVIVSSPSINTICNSDELFGKKIREVTPINEYGGNLCRLRRLSGKGELAEELYAQDVMLTGEKWGVFLIARNKEELLAHEPNIQGQVYVRADLRKVCSELYNSEKRNRRMQVVRLNARLLGEFGDRVNSIALYGPNILRSHLLADILGIKFRLLGRPEENPFVVVDKSGKEVIAESQHKRFLDIKSCCIRHDNGKDRPVSFNVDIFGNYSFLCDSISTFRGVDAILSYFQKLSALVADMTYSPLKKSSKALDIIAAAM